MHKLKIETKRINHWDFEISKLIKKLRILSKNNGVAIT